MEDARTEQISAAGLVADNLAKLILTQMVPGTSLPSEAELAARYAVSRLTVREAVKLLEGRGLLELARGKRAMVRVPDGSAFTDFLTAVLHNDSKGLFDLIEVRLSLEVQSATLAAKRASRAGLSAIETALEGMRIAASEPDGEMSFREYDVRFHEAIALASGNRVIGYLSEAMAGPLRQGFAISRQGQFGRGHTLQDTVDAHQKIFDAIKAGNARGAADAMRFHLKDTERDIRKALANISTPSH